MAERLTRTCATCNISDTHAHHVQYVALNHPITGDTFSIASGSYTKTLS